MTVKGPKGELVQAVNPAIKYLLFKLSLTLTRPTEKRTSCICMVVSFINQQHGSGCIEGYKKNLNL